MSWGSRAGRTFVAILVLASIVLALFALLLAQSQRDAREDIEDRFHERAEVTAALTESLFAATTGTGQAANTETYGGRVSTATMDETVEEGNNVFAALLSEDGELLAASSQTAPELEAELEEGPPWIRGLFDADAPYGLSDVLDVGDEGQAIGLATGVITPFERRALVTGVSPELLSSFIGGYLGEVPAVDDGNAYVLDGSGVVIGSERGDAPVGDVVDEPGLADAVATGTEGEYGDGLVFATAPIANSEWNVVTTAPDSSLFATVNGADKWIPWTIFALLALAAVVALILVRRSFADRERLAAGNRELAAAQDQLEITNAALERRARELARSNAELDQFASIASHDLQEPLRKVQAFSSQVMETESDALSDKGKDYLRRASSSALRMQDLIEDLLRFSRVGTHTEPFVPTDLGTIASAVVSDLDAVVTESGARVEIGELPTVPVDPPQARQLLQNLISNALKFRREGVEHEVRVEGRVEGRFAEITVSDNGIGFEPEYAERIFRVFERLHGRGTYPGTGIGLALCRKIAERHGGTIGAESRPGEGSKFVVRLPLEHENLEIGTSERSPGSDDQGGTTA